jgi:hypothetical protein
VQDVIPVAGTSRTTVHQGSLHALGPYSAAIQKTVRQHVQTCKPLTGRGDNAHATLLQKQSKECYPGFLARPVLPQHHYQLAAVQQVSQHICNSALSRPPVYRPPDGERYLCCHHLGTRGVTGSSQHLLDRSIPAHNDTACWYLPC